MYEGEPARAQERGRQDHQVADRIYPREDARAVLRGGRPTRRGPARDRPARTLAEHGGDRGDRRRVRHRDTAASRGANPSKGVEMRRSRTVSRAKFLICPLCGSGELRRISRDRARCGSCCGSVHGWTLELLSQVAALPDALGRHACECGHPEMRRLPDGVVHCPAYGSEALPVYEAQSRGYEAQSRGAASELRTQY